MITVTLLCWSFLILVASLFLIAVGGAIVATLQGEHAIGRSIVSVLDSLDTYLYRLTRESISRDILHTTKVSCCRAKERLANTRADMVEAMIDDNDRDDDRDDDAEGDPICDQCFTSKECPTPEACSKRLQGLRPSDEDPAYCVTKLPPSDQYPQAVSGSSLLKRTILVRGAADGVVQ